MRRSALAIAVTAALALAPVAAAHVTVVPAFLEGGPPSTLTVTAPNERAPHAMVRLTLTAPAEVDLLTPASPPGAGWRVAITGRTATWTGGRTEPRAVASFTIRASTSGSPGAVEFHAAQRYDDGGVVRWTIPFTILPAAHAPKQHLWPALLVGVVGLIAIGGMLAWLQSRRRLRGGSARA